MSNTIHPHSKIATGLKFAIMMKDYSDLPYLSLFAKRKQWRKIKEFAAQHKECCGIEY